jgi:Arc/MetJ-type ribon-helix-helix transcriptional regulator
LSGAQLIEQSLCVLQIHCVEAFGKPAVDRSEKLAGFIALTLIAPEPRHAHRSAQFETSRLLLPGDGDGGEEGLSGAAVIDQHWPRDSPLTEAVRHPYTIHMDVKGMVEMADNVHQLRPKPSDTEKITINLGYVDLGHIDLMVQDGFYSNRTDFIRTAIRNQLERHADVVKLSTARKSLDLGLRNYSRQDLEEARRAGQMLEINVLGLATIAADVTPELARTTIASVVVLGALHANPEVKAALADRMR